jgi:CheY-like chemotaxis protein
MSQGEYLSHTVYTMWLPEPGNRLYPTPTGKHSQAMPLARSSREFEGKPRVLIIDDVPDVTEMLDVLLSYAGYEVVTAHSAAAAIAEVREHHFDVIISDIGMPEMNGYELAKAVRAVPGYETVPMVAVTGYSMFDDRERSLRSGFNAHMTKPIEPRALLDLIEQL